METLVKTSKINNYVQIGGEIIRIRKGVNLGTVKFEEVCNNTWGWVKVEADTAEEALMKMHGIERREREETKERAANYRVEFDLKQAERWAELSKMESIPATAENIEVVLNHLNTQNWGGWVLPKMSISYSANQYDCDGVTATTISLDSKIEYDGEMISKFKVGGKRGHLNNYRSL
jgi:hypothetical protein